MIDTPLATLTGLEHVLEYKFNIIPLSIKPKEGVVNITIDDKFKWYQFIAKFKFKKRFNELKYYINANCIAGQMYIFKNKKNKVISINGSVPFE